MITNKPQPEPYAIALELDEILVVAVDGITGEVIVQDPGDAILDREFESAKQAADFTISGAGFLALVRDLVKSRRLIAETADFLDHWKEARDVYTFAVQARRDRKGDPDLGGPHVFTGDGGRICRICQNSWDHPIHVTPATEGMVGGPG